jgi:ribosomal protein S18 acetylase RimI-like enzyme
MDELLIEALSPKTRTAAAHLISRATLSNPVSVALWCGKSEAHRLRMERLYHDINLGHPHNQGLVARLGDQIVGACNWIAWPHCQISIRQSLRFIPYVFTTLQSATLRAIRLYTTWARFDPQEPHWHLDMIGVLPEAQGQGVADRLLQHLCGLLDQENIPAHTETAFPWFVDVHQHLGFEVTAETQVLGIKTWILWRPPRGVSR